MSRVDDIKWHEAEADSADKDASEHRWVAAKLIWEELKTGKSQRQLAEEIGKSAMHVNYMNKCHKIRKLKFTDGELPNFNTVYNSEEVRGAADSSEGRKQKNKGSSGSSSSSNSEEDDDDGDYDEADEEDEKDIMKRLVQKLLMIASDMHHVFQMLEKLPEEDRSKSAQSAAEAYRKAAARLERKYVK